MTLMPHRVSAFVVFVVLAWLAPAAVTAETPVQVWAAESTGHAGAASGQPGCGVTPFAHRAMAIDVAGID